MACCPAVGARTPNAGRRYGNFPSVCERNRPTWPPGGWRNQAKRRAVKDEMMCRRECNHIYYVLLATEFETSGSTKSSHPQSRPLPPPTNTTCSNPFYQTPTTLVVLLTHAPTHTHTHTHTNKHTHHSGLCVMFWHASKPTSSQPHLRTT